MIFLCHLAIEKTIKALIAEINDEPAPRSHNLILLLTRADIILEPRFQKFITAINDASIPTRYPIDMEKTIKDYPVNIARDYLKQTEEVTSWLKSHLS